MCRGEEEWVLGEIELTARESKFKKSEQMELWGLSEPR